jgi:hypothetical protein
MWPREGYFWPGASCEETLAEFTSVFAMYGYEYCGTALMQGTDALEPGYEKIALYAKGAEFTHVARQNRDGSWTSKLGSDIDIRHDHPNDLPEEGLRKCKTAYGVAMHFFKRRVGFVHRLRGRLAIAISRSSGRRSRLLLAA